MAPWIYWTLTSCFLLCFSWTADCNGQIASPSAHGIYVASGDSSREINFRQDSQSGNSLQPLVLSPSEHPLNGRERGGLGQTGDQLLAKVSRVPAPQWITAAGLRNQNQIVEVESVNPDQSRVPGSDLVTGLFYGSFDSMFLSRSGPSPQALVYTDGVPTLTTASFSYDAEFTPALTLGMGDPWGYALEFNYFDASNHDFNGIQQGTTVVPMFFGETPAIPASSYTISAQASLSNYELNQWVRYTDRLRLGVGLRVLDLHEEYRITATDMSSSFFADASNQLFGGQVTTQYVFFSNRFAALYFQGKAGMYYNRVEIAGVGQGTSINPRSNEMSIVGDLRLAADLPLSKMLSFRIGYHATFLSRIAQAIDQNDDLSLATPENPGLIDFSTPTYSGGFFGVVGSY